MPEELDRHSAHLGRGWAFPIRINVQGGLQLTATTQNIEESIHLILRTELGERVYRPTFGSRLSELTFAPMNTQTLLLLRLHIQEALEMWEPRIEIDAIHTDPDPLHGRINIHLMYHCKETAERRSLVYPFYLLPTDGI